MIANVRHHDQKSRSGLFAQRRNGSAIPRRRQARLYAPLGFRARERGQTLDQPHYETVGYVISGSAKLELEGQTLVLKTGDSWLVPAGATHQYKITEHFKAIEATAPPAEVHGRDTP